MTLYLGAILALGLLGGALWWAGSDLTLGPLTAPQMPDRTEVLRRMAPIVAERRAEIRAAQEERRLGRRLDKARQRLTLVQRRKAS